MHPTTGAGEEWCASLNDWRRRNVGRCGSWYDVNHDGSRNFVGPLGWCWRHRNVSAARDSSSKGVTPQRLWLPNVLIGHVMVSRGHGQRLDCDAQVDPAFNAHIVADPTGLRVAAMATRPYHDILVDNLAVHLQRIGGIELTQTCRLATDSTTFSTVLLNFVQSDCFTDNNRKCPR